jgi:hypothetical protein
MQGNSLAKFKRTVTLVSHVACFCHARSIGSNGLYFEEDKVTTCDRVCGCEVHRRATAIWLYLCQHDTQPAAAQRLSSTGLSSSLSLLQVSACLNCLS